MCVSGVCVCDRHHASKGGESERDQQRTSLTTVGCCVQTKQTKENKRKIHLQIARGQFDFSNLAGRRFVVGYAFRPSSILFIHSPNPSSQPQTHTHRRSDQARKDDPQKHAARREAAAAGEGGGGGGSDSEAAGAAAAANQQAPCAGVQGHSHGHGHSRDLGQGQGQGQGQEEGSGGAQARAYPQARGQEEGGRRTQAGSTQAAGSSYDCASRVPAPAPHLLL